MLMQSTLHRTNPIPPWGLDKDEMTCGNCKYWDTATTADMGISPLRQFGICGCYAIEPDAGHGTLVLLGPESHCQQHAADFEPSEDFLAEGVDKLMTSRHLCAIRLHERKTAMP